MKTTGFAVLALFLASNAVSTPSFASEEMMNVLRPMAEKLGLKIDRTEVRGTTARAQLAYYAEYILGWEEGYDLILRGTAKDLPTGDADNRLVLTKIVDVADVAYLNLSDNSTGGDREANAILRNALFQVRDLGALVGATSYGSVACGVTIPGIVVLDVAGKELFVLAARSGC